MSYRGRPKTPPHSTHQRPRLSTPLWGEIINDNGDSPLEGTPTLDQAWENSPPQCITPSMTTGARSTHLPQWWEGVVSVQLIRHNVHHIKSPFLMTADRTGHSTPWWMWWLGNGATGGVGCASKGGHLVTLSTATDDQSQGHYESTLSSLQSTSNPTSPGVTGSCPGVTGSCLGVLWT